MLYPKIKPMRSTRTNAPVTNQYAIDLGHGDYAFQSYSSLIAVIDKHGLRVSPHWDFSRTTTKYLNQWLQTYGTAYQARIGMRELIKRGDVLVTLEP